ncbi:MAG: type II toxin-antitoxin system HicA family toxin [archaeon]|nr:type II toxin-antitoxin system HicA family toxin [archaeon]MCP8316653.1 type II toxin-antitoxin system HicA family toxin [archaeon]MCP8319543.1 type II toxin-antitoxin system HicA family toxin [archaeon]
MGWREAIKALSKKGFYVTHQRGSHIYLTNQDRKHKVTVPRHETIKAGTLLSIIEQAGLTRNEFIALLD